MAAEGRWRRTGREVLHTGRFLRLLRDTVERPGAPGYAYEHVQVADGVRVVALDGRGQVVLVEDEFYLTGRRMPSLPGGGVEPGELPEAAARRELEEETGLLARHWEPLGAVHPLPGASSAMVHLFRATGLHPGRRAPDDTEGELTVRECPFAEALAMALDGRITEAGSVTALLLADRRPTGRPAPTTRETTPGATDGQ
ncbi:NUDIX domain-containing protein [Kitasatospora sp. NPDC048365]|uniref:NUDIX domain-containing protein n=1 Tax=Kitasatospora sp. NPDC048365 TaxID=3364050 RepID=UPI00371B3551